MPRVNSTFAAEISIRPSGGDDNAAWVTTVAARSITWQSPQTFAQNPNSSALRWGDPVRVLV